jgi:hypothetical protein
MARKLKYELDEILLFLLIKGDIDFTTISPDTRSKAYLMRDKLFEFCLSEEGQNKITRVISQQEIQDYLNKLLTTLGLQ